MESSGAPAVCTVAMIPQNPPSMLYVAPLILPASGCPAVPMTEYTAPVLAPPPPSMVCQSMEYDWDITRRAQEAATQTKATFAIFVFMGRIRLFRFEVCR